MELPIYQVDAFTDKIFGGNPAAVIPLQSWLDDDVLQKIAAENNLSETAFFVATEDGYHLRWFTPTVEIQLCGHATLASAFVIFDHLDYDKDTIEFETLSGPLYVKKSNNALVMDFPAATHEQVAIPDNLSAAIDAPITALYKSTFMIAVTDSAQTVKTAKPDFDKLKTIETGDFILTAASDDYDFVSRCFVPLHGINEDPVTGSAHCAAAPLWAAKLGKQDLRAYQVSARGGAVNCALNGDRVALSGPCALYLKGSVFI